MIEYDMKVINFFAGPGAGKTTTAAGLFYKMKMNHMNVELVHEYARELIYDGRMDRMIDAQDHILGEQNRRLHILKGHVDFAISDSPLLLSAIYPPDSYPQSIKPFAVDLFNEYDNINILLLRPDAAYQEEDGGRRHNLEQAEELDKLIEDALCKYTTDAYQIFKTSADVVDRIYARLVDGD